MPRILHGREMTAHEHEIWKRAYESAKSQGYRNPGAIATAAVEKYRAKRGRKSLKRTT